MNRITENGVKTNSRTIEHIESSNVENNKF